MDCKKFDILLIGLLFAVAVQAQSPAAKARVAEIRKMYANVKLSIAMADTMKREDGLPRNDMVVTSDYMVGGAGSCKDVVHYYFSGDFDENLGRDFYQPYFITHQYNVVAWQYYQEFLFDDEGRLVFYYEKSQGEDGEDNETRFYFGSDGQGGEDGLVHEIIRGSRTIEKEFATRIAYELMGAFNNLINREF